MRDLLHMISLSVKMYKSDKLSYEDCIDSIKEAAEKYAYERFWVGILVGAAANILIDQIVKLI
jgi:hypothetical protein